MADATIRKDTFQRLVLMYLINQFPQGVYSNFRLQKVLYYGCRGEDGESRPFTFHHTRFGQYSCDARGVLDEMHEEGLIEQEKLTGEGSGVRWQSGMLFDAAVVDANLEAGFPQLARSINASVKEYGFMKQRELDERVHADPILEEVPPGGILIQEDSKSRVTTQLDEETVEELEVLLTPGFVPAMAKLTRTVAETDFDTSKVRSIDSFDDLL